MNIKNTVLKKHRPHWIHFLEIKKFKKFGVILYQDQECDLFLGTYYNVDPLKFDMFWDKQSA